jgi:CubicO group peptidase (beta-lactamase class C family)
VNIASLLDAHFAPENEDQFGVPLAAVVLRGGELLAERYGVDPVDQSSVTADTTLISWSMAKSITQALVGMLVRDGLVDIDAPAPVAAWADDSRNAITIRQLLAMTSGLKFIEEYEQDKPSDCIEMLFGSGSTDVASYAAGLDLEHEPGTVFNYSSGTTNIISAICRDALGGPGPWADYIQQRLFDPLGMSTAIAKTDEAGTFIGSSFVYATAREFAAFGQLYLQDGEWNQERLLPEGWVELARTPIDLEVPEDGPYGAHWWLWENPDGFGAHGYEGQYTIVFPDKDLVVVRLGKSPTDSQKTATRNWIAEVARTA